MRARILPLAAAVAAASAVTLSPMALADDNATVYVLHGVPGATVDVYVNGDAALTNFTPGTLTDALSLPAGEYDLKVTAPGAGADGAAIVEASDVAVPAGANVTVVAHLNASGAPTLTPFVNDVSDTAAGQGRLTVRHTAAAPAVDVRANGEVAFPNVTNPNEAKADLPAGTLSADVVLAGTDTVAIGPADVPVAEGKNTIVYAWGSAADGNLAFAVQSLDGLHSAPSAVPTGTAPLEDATVRILAATSLGAVVAWVMFGATRRREAARL
ncbi:DUF4397 domain-containing protein [Propioniciclava sp. MC1595]|uniref:DUF4397 domain-containing protein n=1 Tax=Propioniciclava sp. MC1595 TaxID=2760308 RepID=UPI0016626A2F|nr:DUF4397 domain-containing protein [Propioniciclava sp. MC1595]MBB1496360.1 DUF4397 domain-containing protein [Propioniciclava sp. MC1595]QTE26797.1 DUF4397 domain-containing protein [Propioniciclava sp. MC1595]